MNSPTPKADPQTRPTPVNSGKWIVWLAALMVIIAGMRAASSIIVPLLLSLFLAIVLEPPMHFLRRKRLPTSLSLIIVAFGMVAVGMVFAMLIGHSVENFRGQQDAYEVRLEGIVADVTPRLEEIGIDISNESIREYFDTKVVMRFVAYFFNNLNAMFQNAFLILVTTLFLLLEASSLAAKVQAIDGSGRLQSRFDEVISNVRIYTTVKTLVSIATGVCVALWLWYLEVNFPFLWGVVAFLLNFVPNVGSLIAAVPPLLLTLVQFGATDGPIKAMWVAIGYLTINQVVGTAIEPRLQGRGLGLSPLVIFLSLVVWGWVLGPVGMLLSAPLTMVVKIILQSNAETKPLAILIGMPDKATATKTV